VTAPLAAPRASLSELKLRLPRERALIALFDLGRQKGYGLLAAKLYAFGVFTSYAIAIALTGGPDRTATIHGLLRAAVISLSWAVGVLAALGSAQALAAPGERDALSTLAMQRGFPRSALRRARTWAATGRVARLLGVPALLLVVVGLMRGARAAWALAVTPALLVYAGVLGLALALLAQFAAELSPRHPRAMLLALGLGPFLVSLAFPAIPSLPQLFGALLTRLLDPGAALS